MDKKQRQQAAKPASKRQRLHELGDSQPIEHPVGSARTSVSSLSAPSLDGTMILGAATKWRAQLEEIRDGWLKEHSSEIYTADMRRDFVGWVELESNPGYWTIMLERLGIESVKVVEVVSMDEMLLRHDCLKYGIIFLSQYYEDDQPDPEEEPPEDLWFSNQSVANACATVAILNIINNVSTLNIGEKLRGFRDTTMALSPVMKAQALAKFHWCRSIHNALAKRTEMLVDNLAVEQEAKSKASKSQSRRKGKRKHIKKASSSDVANHYIAYVPFGGNLWKLDGLDRHPRNLGPLLGGDSWISTVRDDCLKRINKDPSGKYSMLAIIEDELPALVKALGSKVNQLNWIESCLTEKRDYWNKHVSTNPEDNVSVRDPEPIRFADSRFNLTREILAQDGVQITREQMHDLAACSEEHLTLLRPEVVMAQLGLRALIRPLKEDREEQWIKYKDAMFDYGPVIHQWMKFLHENGQLKALINSHLLNEGGVEGGD